MFAKTLHILLSKCVNNVKAVRNDDKFAFENFDENFNFFNIDVKIIIFILL